MADKQEEKGLSKPGAPIKGEVVSNGKKGEIAKSDTRLDAEFKEGLEALGFRTEAPVETVQTGGITKWVDMRAFMSDPTAPDGKPCKGNGRFIAGLLLSRHEMEDDENGEVDPDSGKRLRYFYTIRLSQPCPVTYKNENREDVKEEAAVKEIVALGERYSLRNELRKFADDVANGGIIAVGILPVERIKVSPSRTMWTFDVKRIVIRHAPKLVATPGQRTPF